MPEEPELFSIVPVTGKSPADAIVTGPMSEVTTYIGQSIARIAEEERLAQAQRDAEETERHQAETRACNAQIFADGVAHLATRLDQYEARKKAHADQLQREKEEVETARIEAVLAAHPDPDDPFVTHVLQTNPSATQSAPHPTAPTPGDGSSHEMGDDGGFEAVNPPPDKEKHNPEARGDTITGLTPPELEKATPPEPGDYGPTAPAPSPYRNPASIGLN